jgi:hypothetical protein
MRNQILREKPFAFGSVVALVLCVLTFTSLGSAARPGDLAKRWPVNDEDPSGFIPSVEERNKDPMEFGYFLQDLIARATAAYAASNWALAVKYYEAMAKAVPDTASAFSKLCVLYAKLEQQDVAIAYCAKATTLPGSKVFDHLHLVDLTLRKTQLTAGDVTTIEESLQHLRNHAAQHPQQPPGPRVTTAPVDHQTSEAVLLENLRQDVRQKRGHQTSNDPSEAKTEDSVEKPLPGYYLPTEIELRTCKLAVLTADDGRLTACIAALREHKVNDRLLLPFSWAQALGHQDAQRADQLLKEAAGYGLPQETLDAMQDEQDRAFGSLGRIWKYIGGGVLAALAALGAGLLLRQKLKKAPSLRPQPPPQSISTEA